jgi:hypothetical protein
MATAATTRGRKTRKAHTAPTVRASTNYFSSNGQSDTTSALRLQRLNVVGLRGCTAALIAALAWGEVAHHG